MQLYLVSDTNLWLAEVSPREGQLCGHVSSQGASHSSGMVAPALLLSTNHSRASCWEALKCCAWQDFLSLSYKRSCLLHYFQPLELYLPHLNTADMNRARFKPKVYWRNGFANSQRHWIPDISCEDQFQVCYSMSGTTEHALHRAPLSFSIYCNKHNWSQIPIPD